MYRTKGGKLLMIWSSGTNNGYVKAVLCSGNGNINRSWKHSDKLLFEKDSGHRMIFDSFDGQKYFVCHQPNFSPYERPILKRIVENNGTLELG